MSHSIRFAPAYPPDSGFPAMAAPLDAISTRAPCPNGAFSAAWTPYRPAFTSVSHTAVKASQDCSSSGAMKGAAPAFRISTEGLTSATTALISPGSVTSPGRAAAPSRSTSASRPGSRATTVTCTPRASSASTIPSPSPRLPPVTTTPWSRSVVITTNLHGTAEGPSTPVMDIAHLACDRFERSETGDAFHVRPHVGMLSHSLDILDALPLGVVDDASTILADMNAGRYVAGELAHEGFRALFEDGDQPLLILGIHGKDVDQRHDPAVSANRHFHQLSPVLGLGRGHRQGERNPAKAADDEGAAGSFDHAFGYRHCTLSMLIDERGWRNEPVSQSGVAR